MTADRGHTQLGGISAAPGVAIGRALIYSKEVPAISRRRVAPEQVAAEEERFLSTLHQAAEEIRRTRRLVAAEQGPELAQIFDAQLAMLQDVVLVDQTLTWIRQKHYVAERAFSLTLQQMKKRFASIEDDYLRQRLSDVVDIEHQVLIRLAGGEVQALQSLRTNTVVVAHELLPSESVQLGRRLITGLVLDVGGPTSHTAIIARSLGLPTVLGTGAASRLVEAGDLVVVDGNHGQVHIRPGRQVLRDYRGQLRRQRARERALSSRSFLPAVTTDGVQVTLMANIDVPAELKVAAANGAHGVGMYRTEFLFMGYRLPTEEEQLAAYTRIVEESAPHPVTIRTVDMGGDKLAPFMDSPPESNPFLGWRGIRICLDTPDLFRTQLRALLRAGARGPVRILLPMISHLEELRRTRALIEQSCVELGAQGLEHCADCPVGIMVEVPSVALLADHFAREADFFSLGTNDLIQYTLAVDRGTSRVAQLYDPFHPAVLQLIRRVADSGRRHRIATSICGEMAGDPLTTVLLLGLGVQSLSMSPGMIPEVKEVVRSVSQAEVRRIAEDCLRLRTGAEVRQRLGHADPSPSGTLDTGE
ncbi:MAG: phosphoenolpyruvate--protein phosphotransferase [Candidatus Latescibacterota bacterium]